MSFVNETTGVTQNISYTNSADSSFHVHRSYLHRTLAAQCASNNRYRSSVTQENRPNDNKCYDNNF